MPLQIIKLRPGLDTEKTPTLNSASWSSSNLIRFRDGLPEKIGGWQAMTSTQIVGVGRAMHAWADLESNPYIAVGTNERLQLFEYGSIYDITPFRSTHNVAPNFSTTANSPVVTVVDVGSDTSVGDGVYLATAIYVGGLLLQGFYQVQSVISSGSYTIVAANSATADASNSGVTATYTSNSGSSIVGLDLGSYVFSNGQQFTVGVPTEVGGLTVAGVYPVSVSGTNVFSIVAVGTASSGTSVSENGGQARLDYLVAAGGASLVYVNGYGIGLYGQGNYGTSSSMSNVQDLRLWFLDNWGQDLIGNYTDGGYNQGSTLYLWTPPTATGNVAVPITGSDVPQHVNVSFVAQPEQMLFALGCDPVGGGNQDPNLVRWCDVEDYTDWTPTAANQAGSYRIPSGSRLMGGLQGPQFTLIWTDIDMWLVTYLGAPLVWGFQKVASGCDLLAPNAAGIYQSIAVWASNSNFFMFDGSSVRVIPCPVWDVFWKNLNRMQKSKIFCAVNSWFGEATWYFPSASGNGEVDSYVQYNIRENLWTYGSLVRTAWIDDNVYGAPVGLDGNGILQQHEMGTSANGQPMGEFIQSGMASISDGTYFTFIERIIPDFDFLGTPGPVQVSVITQNYPADQTRTFGPYDMTPGAPEYAIVRGRGRTAGFLIGNSAADTFWRLGALRYLGAPAGRR